MGSPSQILSAVNDRLKILFTFQKVFESFFDPLPKIFCLPKTGTYQITTLLVTTINESFLNICTLVQALLLFLLCFPLNTATPYFYQLRLELA